MLTLQGQDEESWFNEMSQYCDTDARKFNTILGYIKRCIMARLVRLSGSVLTYESEG